MEFEYRINVEDLKEGYRAIQKIPIEKTNLKRLMRFALGLPIMMSVYSIIKVFILKETILPIEVIVFLFSILIPIFIQSLPQFPLSITDFQLTQQLENSPNKGEATVIAGDEGLTITTPACESKMKWFLYTHWQETLNLFLVYRQFDLEFVIFPKRAFANDIQINNFRQLLYNNLLEKTQNKYGGHCPP
jgi:YcxB-like protein